MKRKLSFILAAVMLACNIVISSVIAADTKATFTDVDSSTQYSEAILTLAKLGIINGYSEDNTFRPQGEIKRAEFTAIITRAMNIADGVGGTSTFTDVTDHWALNNIIAASSRGIINGYNATTFGPEDPVTYEQAVKMLVCALNYTNTAEALGGYPDGYIKEGTELGLTKSITGVTNSAPAVRGVIAQLVFNAFDIKVADLKTSEATKDTFIGKFMNMEKVTGKVVGVEDDTTAECPQTLSRDEMAVLDSKTGEIVSIDFSTLFEDVSDVSVYLGQEVLVFYKIGVSGGMNELAVLDSEVTENIVTEVFYDDIEAYADGVLEYYNENGKRERISFSPDEVTFYYNKKAVSSGVSAKLNQYLDPSSEDFIYGEVKFTDSGADKKIDMVDVMDYEFMVATKTPSSNDYTITNKVKFTTKPEGYIPSLVLNPDKSNPSFTITDSNGAKITTTSIKANSVLLVAASEDENMYTVKASTETVTGSINSYSEGENLIKVAGKDYIISDYCIDYLTEQGTPISTGSNGTFYTDAYGTIVYGTVKANSDTATVAYMISAIYNEDDDTAKLKVFVPGSGYKEYSLTEKTKVDGSSLDVSAVVERLQSGKDYFLADDAKATSVYGEGKNVTPSNASQLVMLELSGSSVKGITTMESAVTATSNDSSKIVRFSELAKAKYISANNFNNKFYTNSSTTFIYVPRDRTETKSYAKRSASNFSVGTEYWVEPYNVDSSKIANIVIVYGTSASGQSISKTTPMSFVGEAPREEDDNGELVTKLSLFTNSDTSAKTTVDEDEDSSSVKCGDIIQFGKTSDGFATGIKVRISFSDIASVLDDASKTYDWTDSKFEYETTETRTGGMPYGATYIYNVIERVGDTQLVVTREGFTEGKLADDVETMLVSIDANTKFIAMNSDRKSMSAVDKETDATVTIEDLKEAKYEDSNCSKVAISTITNDIAKVIAIYR